MKVWQNINLILFKQTVVYSTGREKERERKEQLMWTRRNMLSMDRSVDVIHKPIHKSPKQLAYMNRSNVGRMRLTRSTLCLLFEVAPSSLCNIFRNYDNVVIDHLHRPCLIPSFFPPLTHHGKTLWIDILGTGTGEIGGMVTSTDDVGSGLQFPSPGTGGTGTAAFFLKKKSSIVNVNQIHNEENYFLRL